MSLLKGELSLFNLAMSHIAKYLNQFLKRQFDLEEDIVVLSGLSDTDGSIPTNINNKIVIFLFNIEKDYMIKNQPLITPGITANGDAMPLLHINLNIVVAANFNSSNYGEALKLLSAACQYFQTNPVFDHQNTPDLDNNIQKLILEIENINNNDLSNLWGIMGGKYLPSIVYKLKTVTISSQFISKRINPIETVSGTVESDK